MIGTVVGACAGQAVMSAAATKPAALAAALAAGAAVAGWFAVGVLRVGVALAMFTFVSVVLCQVGCCRPVTPSTDYFLARMVSVSLCRAARPGRLACPASNTHVMQAAACRL